jgi:hypothetical protein
VNSKIIVNAKLFQRMNPNYTRLSVNISRKRLEGSRLSFWTSKDLTKSNLAVQINKVDLEEANDDNLLLFSLTVLSFSLNNKLWCKYLLSLFLLRFIKLITFIVEFAVVDITPIT